MVAIQIPKPFIKRIFVFCNKEQRDKEISNFARRHGWKESLIRNKIDKLKEEYGY
jgi:GTP-binding protein EngB required for normal cell division